MSNRSSYHTHARFVVTPENVEVVRSACSPSGRYVVIVSGRERYRLRVHTLRGVPGKHADVLLPDSFNFDADRVGEDGNPTPNVLVCEIGKKAGSFDGAIRWRLAFRHYTHGVCLPGKEPTLEHPGPGTVEVREDDPDGLEALCRWKPLGIWAQCFPRLEFAVDERTDRRAVLVWQWRSWFKHLTFEDASQLADYWACLPAVTGCADIVVLNRLASEALYDLSRQLGWRKLSLKERKNYRIGEDVGPWVRADWLARRKVDCGYSGPGAGEYTLTAAAGTASSRDYVKTAHGVIGLD